MIHFFYVFNDKNRYYLCYYLDVYFSYALQCLSSSCQISLNLLASINNVKRRRKRDGIIYVIKYFLHLLSFLGWLTIFNMNAFTYIALYAISSKVLQERKILIHKTRYSRIISYFDTSCVEFTHVYMSLCICNIHIRK